MYIVVAALGDRSTRRMHMRSWGTSRKLFAEHLAPLGIQPDRGLPHDPHIVDDRFYTYALPRGIGGILDAYVAGWWECEALDDLAARILIAGTGPPARRWLTRRAYDTLAQIINQQTRRRSLSIRKHYDLGNDLFRATLGQSMVYSCAYWRDSDTLDSAQEAKLDLICRKLGLTSGMKVLDIGCGWGSFARFAAERYDVSVVGITLSEPQAVLGRELCEGTNVELRVQDYRELGAESFDRVVSIGMFEHVGPKNYRKFMSIVRNCLLPDGMFLLQTIGNMYSTPGIDPWISSNIFPNANLPSCVQLASANEGILLMEDWHNFGSDYDRTLMAWYKNFDARWDTLQEEYGDQFYRMWRCYLMICAAIFRARQKQLFQIVYSLDGVPGGYRSVR